MGLFLVSSVSTVRLPVGTSAGTRQWRHELLWTRAIGGRACYCTSSTLACTRGAYILLVFLRVCLLLCFGGRVREMSMTSAACVSWVLRTARKGLIERV